jgi:hypothetical protein
VRADVQALAYVMRRPTRVRPEVVVAFYRDVLGLPVAADHGSVVQHWLGQNSLLKLTFGDDPERREGDPGSAACVPVLLSRSLNRTVARLRGAGCEPVGSADGPCGRTVFVRGPDDLLTGIEQRTAGSPWPADRWAREQPAGTPFRLADLPALPADLQHLSRIHVRCPDVVAMTGFYRALGLDVLGSDGDAVLVDLGEHVTLSIGPGGAGHPPAASRAELPTSITLRVLDLDALLADLQAVGIAATGRVEDYPNGTRIAYVGDPAGGLVGLAQRETSEEIEDVEARRRRKAALS